MERGFRSCILIGLFMLMTPVIGVESDYPKQATLLIQASGRNFSSSIEYLSRLSNSHQVAVLKLLLDAGNYRILDKFPELLEVDNEFAVAAIAAMVQDERKILPSWAQLVRVKSIDQVRAVKALISGRPLGGKKQRRLTVLQDHFSKRC